MVKAEVQIVDDNANGSTIQVGVLLILLCENANQWNLMLLDEFFERGCRVLGEEDEPARGRCLSRLTCL